MRYIIGIDVGTTGTKSVIISNEGQLCASSYESYELETPEIGQNEQDANSIWTAVLNTVKQIVSELDVGEYIDAISLSTQGGTLIPTDEFFNPLCKAIVWSDRRCVKESKLFSKEFGNEYMYKKTGWNLSYSMNALQIAHLKNTNKKLFDKVKFFLSVPDFISAKLCGIPVVDYSNVGINQLADISKCKYDQKILDFCGIKEQQLAKIVPSGEKIGKILPAIAEKMGINKNVVFVSGAHDQYAGILGAGIFEPENILVGTGTAWVVTEVSNNSRFQTGLSQSRTVNSEQWGSLFSLSSGGVCLEWFKNHLFSKNSISYKELDNQSKQASASESGLFFIPFFNGSTFPIKNNEVQASFVGLDLLHDRFSMSRAIMEGVVYQMDWAMEHYFDMKNIKRIKVAGGAGKSSLWMEIMSNITGKELYISECTDLPCIGAAILAGKGSGIFSTYQAGYNKMQLKEKLIKPNQQKVVIYSKLKEKYRKEVLKRLN